MRIQRCLICFKIKSSDEFATREVCQECHTLNRKMPKKKRPTRPDQIAATKEETKKTGTSRKINVTTRLNKLKRNTVTIIMHLLEDLHITEIPGFEEIDVSNLERKELLNNYSFEELAGMLSALEYLYYRLDFE